MTSNGHLTNVASDAGEAASLRNGCLRSSFAVALCSGALASALLRKSSRTGDAWKGTGIEG